MKLNSSVGIVTKLQIRCFRASFLAAARDVSLSQNVQISSRAFCNMPSRCKGEVDVLLYLYPTLVLEWGQWSAPHHNCLCWERDLVPTVPFDGYWGVISIEVKWPGYKVDYSNPYTKR